VELGVPLLHLIMCKHRYMDVVGFVNFVRFIEIVQWIQSKHGANAKDSANQSGGHRNKVQSIWYKIRSNRLQL
jgi:hypothetical protein